MPSPHRRFFLDENIPLSTIKTIRDSGFDVSHARECGLQGAEDKEIAEYAKNKQAILVTKDVEFSSILLYPKNSHYGLIVLRLPHLFTAKQINAALSAFLREVNAEDLVGKIIVLETGRFRVRSYTS